MLIPFPSLKGKSVLLVSHDFTITGAPLLLMETGRAMQHSGADVSVCSLDVFGSDSSVGRRDIAREHDLHKKISLDEAMNMVPDVDLIVANTALAKDWIRLCLDTHPNSGQKIFWWIHEITPERYGEHTDVSKDVAAVVMTAHACVDAWRAYGFQFPSIAPMIWLSVNDDFQKQSLKTSFPFSQNRWIRRFGLSLLRTREQIRESLGVAPSDVLVSMIGSYIPRKGQDVFLQTMGDFFEEYKGLPIKLMITGLRNTKHRDQELAKLSPAVVRALDGEKRFMTLVPDIKPYYLVTDILVVNAQDRGENFGRITTEAMAFGKPVIGTRAGGTAEIVEDGVSGFLFPVGEAGQAVLKEHLARLVRDEVLRSSMGEAARQRVKDVFNDGRFFREMNAAFEAVLCQIGP